MLVETMTDKKHGKELDITLQRRELVWRFIWEFRRVKRISPTFVEIAKGIGYSENSEGTVHKTLVEPLIAEGWLEKVQPGSRSILPLKKESDVYCVIKDPELKHIAKQQRNLRILRRL